MDNAKEPDQALPFRTFVLQNLSPFFIPTKRVWKEMKMSRGSTKQEPPYAKHLSRLVRPFANFDFFFIKGVREKAAAALQLSPGANVLDLCCGSGGSFPFLVNAIGSTGTVVGVDISHQSCENAKRRIASNGWKNVHVIEASADSVAFSGRFDGVLMFAAPDAYASESVLLNVLPYLNSRARVVIFGAKLSTGRLRYLLNPFFLFMCRTLSPETPLPDKAPWMLLAGRLDDVTVQEFFYGSMFLACGTLKCTNTSAADQGGRIRN